MAKTFLKDFRKKTKSDGKTVPFDSICKEHINGQKRFFILSTKYLDIFVLF